MRNLIFTLLLANFFCATLNAQQANCERIEHKNPDSEVDPIAEEICRYKNLKNVAIGTPDYKGRYSWTSELFLVTDSEERQLQLTDVFRDNSEAVEKYLNNELEKEYKSNSNEPELSDCMESINFRTFELNEFRLTFIDSDLVSFWVEYGTGSACFNVNLGLATMTYEQFDSLAEITSHNRVDGREP